MGFRYFSDEGTSIPDLNWTREIVEQLAWIIHDFASEKRKGALKD